MAKADIDFEKELWDAANELRGAVSENNYKNYILPLVFLKHLSERYDIVHDELEGLIQDPNRIIIPPTRRRSAMSSPTRMNTGRAIPLKSRKRPLGNT
ncbi:MAG: type I restriction-modification system subunit M N-terminal domain-containing protein [Saprospiraceae bacterium]